MINNSKTWIFINPIWQQATTPFFFDLFIDFKRVGVDKTNHFTSDEEADS